MIPSFIILFLSICVFCFIWVSTVGVPDNVRHLIEKELKSLGVDVEMSKLRVSIWGGLYLEARDVLLKSRLFEAEESSQVERLWIDLNMDALWKGNLVLDRIELVNGNIAIPLGEHEGEKKVIQIEELNVLIGVDDGRNIVLRNATAIILGINVSLEGKIPTAGTEQKITKEEFEELMEQIDRIVYYIDETNWSQASPPSLSVRISSNSRTGQSRYAIELEAAELEYKGLGVRDLVLEADLTDNNFWLKSFMCRELDGRGKLDLQGRVSFKNKTVHLGIRSEVPLIDWIKKITGTDLLPVPVQLRDNPLLTGECNMKFTDDWNAIDDLYVIGRASIDDFIVNESLFDRFSCRFSYEKKPDVSFDFADFYFSDVILSQGKTVMNGQVLAKDGKMKFELRNTLTVDTILHLVHAFKEGRIEFPEGVEFKGTPDCYLTGELMFEGNWMSKPSVETAKILLQLKNLNAFDLTLDSIAVSAEVDRNRFIVNQCKIEENGKQFEFFGETRGDNIYFSCKSNIPPSVFNDFLDRSKIIKGSFDLPKKLDLPKEADVNAEGIVSMSPDGTFDLKRINLELHTDAWQWGDVKFEGMNFDCKVYGQHIEYASFNVFLKDRHLDLFVQGDKEGEIMFSGQTTFSLNVFDRLLSLAEDDFFFERFKYTDESKFDISFYGTLDLSNPLDSYDVDASIKAFKSYYQGVLVEFASATVNIASNIVTMRDARLEVDNAPYLREKKLGKGPAKGMVEASGVVIDFNTDSVAITDLKADVFPDYALRMFSKKAAEALEMFRYSSLVQINGSGVFPMEDDFSMMKSSLFFDAGKSKVELDLLGTTLELSGARGTVNITPSWVKVSKLRGKVWGGDFDNGIVDIQIDHGNAINGVISAVGMNLAEIGKSYDVKMSPATVDASASIRSNNGDVKTMTGSGNISLYNGNLVEIPIFGKLGEVLGQIPGVGHLIVYNIKRASCDYYIKDGVMNTDHFVAEGTNMGVSGSGSVDLTTTMVNADLQLSFKGLPKLLTSPVYVLFGGLFKVKGKGPLNNVEWYAAPFSSGTKKAKQ